MGFLSFLFGNNSNNIKDYLEKGAILLDVRTKQEFDSGAIDNAIHIPVQELHTRFEEVKKLNKPVIAYCQSGMRSGRATSLLNSKGVDAINGGGIASLFAKL